MDSSFMVKQSGVMAKKVLLVEDDASSRNAMVALLNQLGHEIKAAWTAEEAKTLLEQFTPDVALLDMRLPGIPGDAFAIYLKKKHPNIRIVFVSGELRLDEPKRFGDNVMFLPKPINFNKLIEYIG